MRLSCILTSIAMVTAGTGIAIAESPKPDEASATDLKKLQGEWRLTKVIKNGKEIPADEVSSSKAQFTFKNSTGYWVYEGKIVERFQITLDAKTDPKRIDLQELDKKGKPAKVFRGRASKEGKPAVLKEEDVEPRLGLYELKGDRLVIRMGSQDVRPKAFDEKGKGETAVWEFERIEK